MNQIPTIPNVSSIYRQLSSISGFDNNKNYDQRNYNNQNYDKLNYNYQNQFQTSQRQNRHEILMSKFKNSFQQNRDLLQIFGSNNRNNITHEQPVEFYQRNSNNSYQQQPFLQRNYTANAYNLEMNNQKLAKQKWRAPKINYRHLQKQQQSIKRQNQQNQTKQVNQKINRFQDQNQKISRLENQNKQKNRFQDQKLQKQFYQDEELHNRNNSAQSNIPSQMKQKSKLKTQNQGIQLSYMNQSFNKGKQAQYQDNLQSYFQLCRKNGSQRQIKLENEKKHIEGYRQQFKQEQNNQKYIRKDVKKIQGINLQKAMKMLQL